MCPLAGPSLKKADPRHRPHSSMVHARPDSSQNPTALTPSAMTLKCLLKVPPPPKRRDSNPKPPEPSAPSRQRPWGADAHARCQTTLKPGALFIHACSVGCALAPPHGCAPRRMRKASNPRDLISAWPRDSSFSSCFGPAVPRCRFRDTEGGSRVAGVSASRPPPFSHIPLGAIAWRVVCVESPAPTRESARRGSQSAAG